MMKFSRPTGTQLAFLFFLLAVAIIAPHVLMAAPFLLVGNTMVYNDISPRTTAYADRRLLTRAKKNNILGQWGQMRPLPSKSTQTIKFRRYNKLAVATVPLAEGVKPDGKVLTKNDIECTLKQYGDFIEISDVIMDTHEDPVLNESIDILGQQAEETIDVLRAGVLTAGTNVVFANGAARADVNDVFTRDTFRTITRILKAQEAKPITSFITAGPDIGTTPIPPAFVVVCHSDAQPDLERTAGWVAVQEYPTHMGIMNGEAGSIGEFRFVFDNNLTPWADIGAAANTHAVLSTTGVNADVYPLLIFGQNAYGIVPLGGKSGVSTYVRNPKPEKTDPLAQTGSVGWKTYNGTVILQDLWMCRLETALKG